MAGQHYGMRDRALQLDFAFSHWHTDRSGFDGPWQFAPTTFINEYYRKPYVTFSKWQERKWAGPPQFVDKATKSLMALHIDMALVNDKGFRPFAEKYAKDE
ncbi:hypothetical protein JCM11641_002928 [Rhodosporidiobolus odoratus]